MDIITHAVVGAATGQAFGQPLLGAVIAVLPDLSLTSIKRRSTPTQLYKLVHSPLFIAIICLGLYAIGVTQAGLIYAAWMSHFVLDFFTHGSTFAPRFFYPLSDFHVTEFEEWEFFNYHWWMGLLVSVYWVIICLCFCP